MFKDSNQTFGVIISAFMAHNPPVFLSFTVKTNKAVTLQQIKQYYETIKENNIFTFPLFREMAA
jgi:hypothetical protein